MRRFKVGILGCGVISRTYIEDIRAYYPQLDLIACADISREAARARAEEFQISKVYDLSELLEDEEVEIVINLTPPQHHFTTSKQIILSGKHLFSEKPFAHSLDQARELLTLAKSKGVKVACAPDTFLASGLQSVRYYLDAGLIGKPFFATANMTTFGVETWHPNPTAFYQKTAGPLYDMAPYYLSAIVTLLGPIRKVAALSASPNPYRHIYVGELKGTRMESYTPTHYTAILYMVNGAVVNLTVSFDIYKSNLPMLEIYGDGGTLTYPDPNFGGGSPRVYRKEQYTDLTYGRTEEAVERSERFYELPELFTRAKDYSRGIGVLDLAYAIHNGRMSRAGDDMILHLTEAIEGIIQAADRGIFYKMTTTCERPRPLVPGCDLNQV